MEGFNNCVKILHKAKVKFTTESFFSGFQGMRIIFPGRAAAIKAEKAMHAAGDKTFYARRHFKKWAIEYYG